MRETCSNTRTCPCGHVLVFETRDIGGDVPEHQNAPTRARSGVRDKGGEEETPECALVGTFWCLGCGERVWRVGDGIGKRGRGGGMPNSKNTPFWACFWRSARCGMGRDVPNSKSTPTRRAFGVRRDVKGRGRAQQQKHALLGVFLAFGAM